MKIKKLLTFIGTVSIAGSTITTVSCGISLNSLQNKAVNNHVFRTSFSNSMTTWNPVATMQSNDIKILAQLNDTLFKPNAKDSLNPLPQLATKLDKVSDEEYTVTLNPDAKWYDFSGKSVGYIEAHDIANTAKYQLNPKSGSETVSYWTQFIRGADSVNKSIDATKPSQEIYANDFKDFIINLDNKETPTNKTGLAYSDKDNTVTFYLAKPAPYFPSLLTAFQYSPTPDKALTYEQGIQYGIDPKNVLTTGPFSIEDYQVGSILKLKRNMDYYDGINGNINEIVYNFTKKSDPASIRQLFETGDYNEAQLMPSDTYGWNKYVGDDLSNPNFQKIQKLDNTQIGLKNILFNYASTDSTIGRNSNIALSLNSVRSLITFAMNRSTLVKYFSGPYDKDETSSFLTNTFNPNGYLSVDGKDYTDLLKEQYNDEFQDHQLDKLNQNGFDAYLNNVNLIQSVINDGNSDKAKQLFKNGNYLEAIEEQVRYDLGQNGINTPVTLTFLMSGANANTWNPYIQKMINDFSNIPNNPIKIISQQTIDDADYQTTQIKGNYSMFMTGWSPGFIDPLAFLQSEKIDGDMASYFGISRLIKTTYDENGNLTNAILNPDYSYDKPGNELIKDLKQFTDDLNKADGEVDNTEQRYEDFAKAENELLYDFKISFPIFKPNGDTIYKLSYIDQTSIDNVGYGNSSLRYDNVTMVKSLANLPNISQDIKRDYVILDKKED